MHLQENTLFDLNLALLATITEDVAQYPQHQVTSAPAKFELTTSKGLGGDAFTRKYII